jgi:hypothetical protein
MIQIEDEELSKLLQNIKLALDKPTNQAALFLGKSSLSTLNDYIEAAKLGAKMYRFEFVYGAENPNETDGHVTFSMIGTEAEWQTRQAVEERCGFKNLKLLKKIELETGPDGKIQVKGYKP